MTTDSSAARLTGWSGDEAYFRFEDVKFADSGGCLSEAIRVLRGDLLGVIYRNMVPADAMASLVRRFQASKHRVLRGAEAPGEYIGTVHYLRPTKEYMEAAPQATAAIAEVLDGDGDPLARFWHLLDQTLRQAGAQHRFARYAGQNACPGLIRSLWSSGGYALDPHEDMSQCSDPRQSDFEIQGVTDFEVAALNICIESAEGGRLLVWNIKPDALAKQRLGISYEGVPYPLASLTGVDRLALRINAGDAYLFNSGHVHAVEPILGAQSRRTAIAALLGFINERTVVSWT
ncbi:MAG TPA: hypothetical protein VMA73_20105 [Streptosporangiaceae bacterium]|nr:hypothetical protein [Streptosporangiaceae bacterium]